MKLICIFKFFLILLFLSSCSGTGKLQKRIDALEKDLGDVRMVHAELTTRINGIENEARTVTGKMEELEYSQTTQIGGIGGDVGTLKQELSRLGKRIPPPALVPLVALEEDEGRIGVYSSEEGRLFSNALVRMRTGSYGEALSLLKQMPSFAQNRDLLGRSLFWTAVAEEGLGNNAGALQSYHRFSSFYSDHPRLPQSLLRQASVFLRLRDRDTARLTLQKLIAQFPGSSEAIDARRKLALL